MYSSFPGTQRPGSRRSTAGPGPAAGAGPRHISSHGAPGDRACAPVPGPPEEKETSRDRQLGDRQETGTRSAQMQEPRSEPQTKVIRQAALNSRASKGFYWESSQGEVSRGSRSGTARAIKAGCCPDLQREIPSSGFGWQGGAKPWENGDTVIGMSGASQSDLDACQQEKIDFP